MTTTLWRCARRTLPSRALLFATLLTAVWQTPARARPFQATQQVEIDLADPDLDSSGGKISGDYRVGETVATTCGNQNGAPSRACVQHAVADARAHCMLGARPCRVKVARHGKPIARPRPNYGPRSFP